MKHAAAQFAAAVLVAAPTAAAAADPGPASSPGQVRAYVQPSVVHLTVHWEGYVWDTVRKEYVRGGRPFEVDTYCTGYVVNPHGYIATAGHCVDPGDQSYQAIAAQAARHQTGGGRYPDGVSAAEVAPTLRVEGYDTSGRGPDRAVEAVWGVPVAGMRAELPYPARVLGYRSADRGDVAVLKVAAAGLPALALAGHRSLDVGSRVVSVGYRGSAQPVADRSLLASARAATVRARTTRSGAVTGYALSARPPDGAGGGPAVGPGGDVVGFATAPAPRAAKGTGRKAGFLRPAWVVNRVLADVGVRNRPGATATAYRAGLDAYFAGDKDAAVARLRAVVGGEPPHAMAAIYLGRARELAEPEVTPAPSEDAGDSPVVPLAVGGGGAALLLVLGGLLLVRRLRAG
ncbi:MAG TPA: trypsin-like peptidase domain-containing protein [Nocardioidaceae bacterium]|nr:trypsin-like peptidase domain-containing protein [Nocardioidaceae bacterium]